MAVFWVSLIVKERFSDALNSYHIPCIVSVLCVGVTYSNMQ